MDVKLTAGHDHRCFMTRAVFEGEAQSPWILHPHYPALIRDKDGSYRGKTTEWLRVICNDPHCPGKALVKVSWLLLMTERALHMGVKA